MTHRRALTCACNRVVLFRIRRFRSENAQGEEVRYKVFTVAIFHNQWTVGWAHDLHGTATLGEWHTFTHALEDVIEGRLPAHHQEAAAAAAEDPAGDGEASRWASSSLP